MSHAHGQPGVECPDCGVVFDLDGNEDTVNAHEGMGRGHHGDGVTFKKPTMVSRVIGRLCNPFRSSLFSPNIASTSSTHSRKRKHYMDLTYDSSLGSKRRRSSDEYSERESKGSLLDSIISASWLRKCRITGSQCSSIPPSEAYRIHRRARRRRRRVYDTPHAAWSEMDVEDQYGDEFGSDRLNLRRYLKPKVPTADAVQAWVNNHKNWDAIGSLLTQDLSCECKDGTWVAKHEMCRDLLLATAHNLQKIQDKMVEWKSEGDPVQSQTQWIVPPEKLRAVMLKCSKSRDQIIDFLEKDL